jgi:uncharacterized protein YggE
VKVRAKEAGDTAQACTSNESSVSGVHFQLGKELEQSSRNKALTKAVKLAKEKANYLRRARVSSSERFNHLLIAPSQ